MATPSPLPDVLESKIFTTREALSSGVGPSRLRARDIAHPFRGVNLVSDRQPTFVQRCRALMAVLPPGSLISHESAARLFDFPVRRGDARSIHVTVPAPYRAPRRRYVVGHRRSVLGDEWMRSAGFAHSTACRAWLELTGSSFTLDEAIIVGDYLVRPRETRRGYRPLATLDELRTAAERSIDRRGARRIARALDGIRERVDSPKETELRLLLLRAGCPELIVNEPFLDQSGRVIVQPDLRIRGFRITLDYEGDHHRTQRRQWMRDVRRFRQLAGAEIVGLRVVADDLEPPGVYEFLDEVQGELDRQGWTGRLRYRPS
jgi:hypothetical protein